MKSLYELFEERVLRCSYYGAEIIPANLFPTLKNEGNNNCKTFICEHYNLGGKESVFHIPFNEQYMQNGKHEHTVALYLLGLLFERMFISDIKEDLNRLGVNMDGWYTEREYMYTWYLTCLYHDVASCTEKIEDQIFPCCNSCLTRGAMPYVRRKMFSRKKPRYSSMVIKNYCHYRICNGVRDHGIHGGMLLYQKLNQNFRKKTRNHPWKDNPVCMRDGLAFRQAHLDHFAYVADAIICHNMWTVQATDAEGVEKYKQYHLEELIIHSDENKLSIRKYPLQFMLCLLDTIEPVKRFENLSAREVLENVSIEQFGKKIRIAWTDKIKQQPEFWKWMNNISTAKDWMLVDVSTCQREGEWCYVTIDCR